MSLSLPPALKTSEISRFALRGSQLEKFKPVIAYWCYYHVVKLILEKELHVQGEDCMTYTTGLMDKLEAWKAEFPNEEAIHDDLVARVTVEQFALETFQRADNAVNANKVSMQTIDTFRAAAVFLDLLGIWQKPLEPEIEAKSRYAKFHAHRITRAIKAGEDPNLSNPVKEEFPQLQSLSPNDPEVRRLDSLQPTVEDASDTSSHPEQVPRVMSPPRPIPPQYPPSQLAQPTGGDVSPLEPEQPTDGYFPPTFTADTITTQHPTAGFTVSQPDQAMTSPPVASIPSDPTPSVPLPSVPTPSVQPSDFYNQHPTSLQPHAQSPPVPSPSIPPSIPPTMPSYFPTQFSQQSPNAPLRSSLLATTQSAPPPSATPPPVDDQQPQILNPGEFVRTDEAMASAKKHAKWAISALEFDDVDTAVKELRVALRALGAR